uniref:DNA 5'-3' helicase n=1 Tax=Thuretia quercifolia TaxID=189650 RepID=A0A1Z1MKA4_9FLOR|nr:Replication helicase subunit [Thuretia quercifolia]ARW66503.1 Replication helicase subunit [Thuretia quercifolia]
MKDLKLYKYKITPQNYLAEEILLGIIIVYPDLVCHIIPLLKKEYFFLESHQILYEYLSEMYTNNILNITEVLSKLIETRILYKIGGIQKILDIMKQGQIFIIKSCNINNYTQEIIKIIQNNYIKRLIIQYGHYVIQLAYNPKISSYKLYNKASSYLNFTEIKITKNKVKKIDELITDLLLEIKHNKYHEKRKKTLIKEIFIKSGILELDKLTSGLMNGDLIVIAGRPSMGKTSLAINIAHNILDKTDKGVFIFSLEMSNKQILNKFISINSTVITKNILLNKLDKYEWKKIVKTCNKLLQKNIYINDNSNISIDYIEYTSKTLKKENSIISLIIIDYLQLIQTNFLYQTNRTQELSYITRKLKLLAQYLNLPIIILSQLNRSIESRTSKKPILSDLKESGCIDVYNQININSKMRNNINIKNIFKYKKYINYKLNYINNKFYLYKNKIVLHKVQKIYILMKYKFITILKKDINLKMTNNHKIFYNSKWIKKYFISDYSLLIINNKQNYIYNNHIKNILFRSYSKLYDLNMQNYFNFICNNIILHNSIEQDADIVMMLYEQKNNDKQNELKEKKILDIIVCKNRNGAVGSFKMIFFPETTIFQNTKIKEIEIFN